MPSAGGYSPDQIVAIRTVINVPTDPTGRTDRKSHGPLRRAVGSRFALHVLPARPWGEVAVLHIPSIAEWWFTGHEGGNPTPRTMLHQER